MNQKEKTAQQRKEDEALNKVLLWFGGAVVLEFFLLLVNRCFIAPGEYALLLRVAQIATVVGAVLTVAAIFWARQQGRQKKSTIFPSALTVFCAAVAFSALLLWLTGGGAMKMLSILVPVAAVLALIYYIYQREFFAVALSSGLGILGLWVSFHHGKGLRSYGVMVIIAIILLVIAALAHKLQKAGGVLAVRGEEKRILPKNANYALLYVTCALVLVVLIAALVVGTMALSMVFYAVPVAWVLIMAVYYTVRLM